jgi:long-chain fatty acid transport protein
MQKFVKRMGVLGVLLVFAATSFGAGFQLYTEGSTEALGQGGAISARRDMLSNAWYNPASMTGFARPALMIGGTLVNLSASYDDSTAGLDADMESHWHLLPHLFYVHPINDKLSYTASITVPYGLATEWEDDWLGNALAIETEIQAVYFTQALSYAVDERLSVAAGFNVVKADFFSKRIVAGTTSDMELNADDYGFGFVLGLNYMLNDEWSVALKYQSEVDLSLEGDVSFATGYPALPTDDQAGGDVTLPSNITLGFTNTSFENLTLGFDVVWTDWDKYEVFDIDFDDPTYEASTYGEPVDKDWDECFSFRLGAEYQVNENCCVRGGYVFDQSPVDRDTVSPELPGNDRHMVMLGAGYKSEKWGVDLAYSYLFMRDSDVSEMTNSNTLGPFGLDPDGEYTDGQAHLVGLSFSYFF